MWMFLLWWCVDDHIAEALNAPGLGHLPLWAPLIIAFAFSTTVQLKGREWRKPKQRDGEFA